MSHPSSRTQRYPVTGKSVSAPAPTLQMAKGIPVVSPPVVVKKRKPRTRFASRQRAIGARRSVPDASGSLVRASAVTPLLTGVTFEGQEIREIVAHESLLVSFKNGKLMLKVNPAELDQLRGEVEGLKYQISMLQESESEEQVGIPDAARDAFMKALVDIESGNDGESSSSDDDDSDSDSSPEDMMEMFAGELTRLNQSICQLQSKEKQMRGWVETMDKKKPEVVAEPAPSPADETVVTIIPSATEKVEENDDDSSSSGEDEEKIEAENDEEKPEEPLKE